MKTELTRLPPYSLEAEQAVLGSMLLDRDAIAQALEILVPSDFYREPHGIIFGIISDLFEKGEPVDIVTVVDALKDRGKLEMVGGASYIASLAQVVPTASNVSYYARIVEEKAILRRLIEVGTKIAGLGYDTETNVEELVDQAEKLVYMIAQKRLSSDLVSMDELARKSFERIESLYRRKKLYTGVPSGFEALDRITMGFQPSDLIIVAARPSVGKTSFCLNIAEHVALKEKIPVAIFSLEMSADMLVQRVLCSQAMVDYQRLRSGFLDDQDYRRLSDAYGNLYHAPIYIDDTPGVSVMEVRLKARKLKAKSGLGLVIVDYLQLMSSRGRAENRVQEISEITRSLKNLARELQVPFIVISQLSREVEKRESKKPQLSDLRESGSIEQDADVVILLYRPDVYQRNVTNPGITEVNIAKHRNGPTDVIELKFLAEYTKFISIERSHKEEY
ncbi:MAG: replicative DNA helicase [Coprothermobacterota bacterium]|nr:replicative DNA helicase [Caldisericota bacterium]MDI6868449.1 replicative DNA helicase [Coprothermobacterota bacterium]